MRLIRRGTSINTKFLSSPGEGILSQIPKRNEKTSKPIYAADKERRRKRDAAKLFSDRSEREYCKRGGVKPREANEWVLQPNSLR